MHKEMSHGLYRVHKKHKGGIPGFMAGPAVHCNQVCSKSIPVSRYDLGQDANIYIENQTANTPLM